MLAVTGPAAAETIQVYAAGSLRAIELAVSEADGSRTITFPCRRVLGGWIKVDTDQRIDLRPTHWREWEKNS
jgi:hypothetical protein